jgi:hypothetical protein
MGTKRSFGSSNRSGSTPQPLRIAFQPIGSDGSIDKNSISSASPGRAPRTAIGPVSRCGPGPTFRTAGNSHRIATSPGAHSASGASATT